ncbi:MAG TPA: response regulator transcription factor [Mucilaginibacter sp.]|jgi:DNA-binding response OmpR family regulator|nr:response regulator transcription factor [Mucilaginibacter sp.]
MDKLEAKPFKILVVEDDPFINVIIKKILSAEYEIEITTTVLKALSYLQKGNIPNLIISDFNMPNMSGLDLIVQLQASDFFKPIPIIILSGEDNSDTRIKCLDSGADDYVVKPFNPAELQARIRAILRRIEKIHRAI